MAQQLGLAPAYPWVRLMVNLARNQAGLQRAEAMLGQVPNTHPEVDELRAHLHYQRQWIAHRRTDLTN
jgi:hypothetical protein